MKLFLFKLIATITSSLISLNTGIANAIVALLAGIFNGVNSALKEGGSFLMKMVDGKRYNHAKLASEQFSSLIELELLIRANHVKDDALKTKLWTINHTIAINQIASALYSQHKWEIGRVHAYMRSIVEAVPGMAYYAGDDFDDTEPSSV